MRRSGTHKADPPPFEPLPDNVFSRRTHPSWHDAYARCVGLFFWAVGRQPPPGTASYDMCSRVLGHLVLEAPTELGRDWVCKKILGCADEHALARLAQKYIFTFVAAFKASVGPSSPARGGLGRGAVGGSSISTPGGDRGARGAALSTYQDKRMLALERDARRCVITGSVHSASAIGAAALAGAPTAAVEATFIIPPSVDIRTLSRYAGFSGDDPFCEPAPSFYRVENLLTLHTDAADEFRSLNVWLEATGRKDEYQIVTWNPTTLAASRRHTTVAFSTTDPGVRPVPSVHYLRLRAACARVAHKSGAAVYIEALTRDLATLSVLAEDGSSAGVLTAALSRVTGG
ncbi:hypothetical protein EDB83DRAFT_436165 [Lactarius deliciosus]|nr:hypothetical protein EDB83DRAFT_436165 [Lactarius deliciosus]